MNEDRRITETDCAYLAGLIDSRGHAYISREKRGQEVYRKIVLEIGPLKPVVADAILEKFKGGRVKSNGGARTLMYVTQSAAMICVHAYPYLLARKEEARLVTRFMASLKGQGSMLADERERVRLEVDRDLSVLHERRRKARA